MTEQLKPTPWQKWPKTFTPLELAELMSGLIGQKRAYTIARQIGRKYGQAWLISRDDFFDWITGDKIYSTELKKREIEEATQDKGR